jgi:calcineurin-like phosphoesterase family protein
MIYFTSDTHFGHEKALNFPERKGFGFTVESWEDLIVDIINKTITKHDRLFILGDFALGGGNFLIKTRMKLRPKDIWLIKGNHCPSDEACKRAFGERFRQVHECKIKETPCWLSHYPHLIWPKSHYGSFHLYGHLHNGRTEYWNQIPELKEMRSLDVCPESYKSHFGEWGIWSEDQIYDLLIARKGHDPVSYYREKFGPI